MKTLFKIYSSIILIIGFCFFSPKYVAGQEASVSFQVFYDGLSPYGNWVDYGSYGYVWVPNAGSDFAPYSTAGHWAYTDDGWVWVSDYEWGWAPFHYGRWYFDDDYGWLWIPGEEWGPAWVSWRSCDGYYGWAPLSPGVEVGFADIPPERWCFVKEGYITRQDVYRYYAPRSENSTYVRKSTIIDRTVVGGNSRTTYVAGPRREDVEKSTGTHITPVSIQSNSHPGQSVNGNNISIYRPTVAKTTNNAPHPSPAKVVDIKNVPRRNPANGDAVNPSNPPVNNQNTSHPSSSQDQKKAQQHQAPAHQQQIPAQHHQQAPPQQRQPIQQQAPPQQRQPVQQQRQAPAHQYQVPAQQHQQVPPQQQAPPQQRQVPQQQRQASPEQHQAPPEQHQVPPPEQHPHI